MEIHYRLVLVYFAINKVARVDFELEEPIERPGKRLKGIENLVDPFSPLKALKMSHKNPNNVKEI